ncbi:CUB and sushi domain-containing protein 1-like [Strongylocentrotus purpuratus]|uniref:SMB domain-containing protein n=1 Tax=Strongylocentrotus purpuratus TaxID=7668 RepID=A0A7M7N6W6_STRPU|nr:CUB and sushi domain-containing protein 1-like [Strongylocentrotus purpuratus]
MDKMDLSSSLVLILVFIVSVDYAASQSDLDNGAEVDTFGYGENLTIVSPNYPDYYPNNVNTQWLVSGPADYQIMAVFSTFDLEYNYDFLRVGSGLDPDDTASLLANLSGSSLPDIIVSNSNEMWLGFTSDGSNTELGFRMNIEVYTPGNYTDLDNGPEVDTFGYGENLTIISPHYPDYYPNNVNTQWLVSGPADYQIMAVFSTFDLEDNYDFLRVGSGLDTDDTASLLSTLSGSILPGIIVSNSNEMWLVFTSDGSNTELGFRMNIEVYIPGNHTDNVTYSSLQDSGIFFADNCVEEFCYGGEETTVCRCDDMCQFFGDCCPDYPLPISSETPSNETLSTETISNETLSNETLSNKALPNESLLDIGVWECIVDSFLPLFYPELGHGYRMIARCPSGWSLEEDVKRNCEEVSPNATIDVLYIYQDTETSYIDFKLLAETVART